MALDEWSFSEVTHSHCSQSVWLLCGRGPAVIFATNSFPAPIDGTRRSGGDLPLPSLS